jgi:adenylyltransferase/sulfurtransferase
MTASQDREVTTDLTQCLIRQIDVDGMGKTGQKRLSPAKVLIVGAGGLGSPVITYLASAGIGSITIADGDSVSATNLNRQFAHSLDDIGRNKAVSATAFAAKINGASNIIALDHFLTDRELEEHLTDCDCIVDCVDDFDVRRSVGRAALRAQVPLVEAGVIDWYGWLLCVDRSHACLECTGLRDIATAAMPPVLGATVGVIGSMQALACIKILLGVDDVAFGRLVNFDGRTMEMDHVELARDEDCPAHRAMRER